MNPRRSFLHKVMYLVAIAVLLGPLFWLSQPSTGVGSRGEAGRAGGLLAQMRAKQGLSESQIGEIDPTSETLRLATLGMRGVAANILWEKANDYKKKKDWSNLKATLNQLIRLEPHFVAVWRHQGWNLSYNVSAEFDDYRERYRWVIKGIGFLQDGIQYNQHSPHLVWDVGWFIGQKIGRADEHKQFRRLFKEDEEFHKSRPLEYRDNWLVGKEWFLKAEDLVAKGASLKQTSPVLFYSDAPMSQMNYSEALATDGVFGEKGLRAWKTASEEWHQFGEREILTSSGEKIHLNMRERLMAQVQEARKKVEGMEPGLREELVQERRKELNSKERRAIDTPAADRSQEQRELAFVAQNKLEIRIEEIARRIKNDKLRDEARKLAEEANEAYRRAELIGRYREIVNFEYWRMHAKVEATEEALAAAENFYNGEQLAKLDYLGAKEAYAKGFAKLRAVLNKFPEMEESESAASHINETLERYVKVLDQADEVFPEDFAMASYIRARVEKQPGYGDARAAIADADKALAKGDLRVARKAFDRAFSAYRTMLDKTPSLTMMSDRKTCAEVMATVRRYAEVLEQLKEPLPQEFVLLDFLRMQIQHAPGAREAQDLVAKGDQARGEQKLAEARKFYEDGFAAWRKVLDAFPPLVRTADRKTNVRLLDVVQRYGATLAALGQKFPEKFVLQDVIEAIRKSISATKPNEPPKSSEPSKASEPPKKDK